LGGGSHKAWRSHKPTFSFIKIGKEENSIIYSKCAVKTYIKIKPNMNQNNFLEIIKKYTFLAAKITDA
jgi:hypothetical protein